MKKLLKGIIGCALSLTLLIGMGTGAYAADVTETNDSNEIMPYSKLKTLFPDVPLREDGYVEGYNSDLQLFSALDEEEFFANPVETHEADYDEGKCTLSIYQDGSYGVCGYEKIGDVPTTRNVGWTISGSTYRSYYRYLGAMGFYYDYTIYTALGTNLSQIHNLTNTRPAWGIPSGYFESQASVYVRQTQTSSAPAQVYGDANLYQADVFCGTFRVTTSVSYGAVSVTMIVV